jgi:hypothetical protein
MKGSRYGTPKPAESVIWISREINLNVNAIPNQSQARSQFAPLLPIRHWLDNIFIDNPKTARLICRLIPARCPFERRITMFGRTILYIPPLCKLNPFYEECVGLRFRALCYLADECHEDVSSFC